MPNLKKSLFEIKQSFDTDKDEKYLINYQHFFENLRDSNISLLELGVFKGGSLLLWNEYFPNAQITGIDINHVDVKQTDRLHFFQGSQSDDAFLTDVAHKVAPNKFDIIIDDASHYGELTKRSFEILYEKHLKPGGIYVIEDWGTGYWEEWPDGKAFSKPVDSNNVYPSHHYGMVGFVKQLIDELAMRDITHERFGTPPAVSPIIAEMHIFNGQVFLRKPLK